MGSIKIRGAVMGVPIRSGSRLGSPYSGKLAHSFSILDEVMATLPPA